MARRLLEFLLWGVNCIPSRLWHCLHNVRHHTHYNTVADCDRVFLTSERTGPRQYIVRYLTPFRDSLGPANPIYLLHFSFYIVRNMTAVLTGRPNFACPSFPNLTWRNRIYVLSEAGLICTGYGALLHWCGPSFIHVVQIVILPLLVSSGILMLFIFTNHLGEPLTHTPDALAGTKSLRVPGIVDFLYCNFSLHVEHHLFPGVNPRHYPRIAEALAREWPGRYKRQTLRDAWRVLLESPGFRDVADDSTSR